MLSFIQMDYSQERSYENISLTNTHLRQSPFYCILYIRMMLAYEKFNNNCIASFTEWDT